MVKIEKCYLVHVNLGGKPSSARIKEAASQIKALVTELSPDHQLAYTSGDGSTFGFFINSHLKSGQITGRINSPGGDDAFRETRLLPSPLRTDDSMLVLEIGEDVSALCSAKALS